MLPFLSQLSRMERLVTDTEKQIHSGASDVEF